MINNDKLNFILEEHNKWIINRNTGKRADLSYADLSYADLRGVNLSCADLRSADLRYANLRDADLSCADLRSVDLRYANLRDADLRGVNLRDADLRSVILRDADLSCVDLSCVILRDADLRGVNLSCADLRSADLRYANLRDADLSCADLRSVDLRYANLIDCKNMPYIPYTCPDTGSFIGYKKTFSNKNEYIVELEILVDAKRCSGTGRKCRCNKAKVLSIQNIDGSISDLEEVYSYYNNNFIYKLGEIVEEPNFCENRWNECSEGIHFFINRQEAVLYNL